MFFKQKKAQTLLEYILVFLMAGLIMYGIAMLFNLKSLKNFAIYGTVDRGNSGKIVLPPMTD